MGEIGFPRHEFLYEVQFWEVQRIIYGYRDRERTLHYLMRRLTFWVVKSSLADTKNITHEDDMWKLPWDEDENKSVSDAEIAEMQAEMAVWNIGI